MPEVFNQKKALPLVLFFFLSAMIFAYLRLNAPFKDMSQTALNMILIALPVIAVSLAADKKWLPIADLGSNAIGLFAAGFILSTILFVSPFTGSMYSTIEQGQFYADYVGVPLSAISESVPSLSAFLLTTIFFPIAEEVVFLTAFFLLATYIGKRTGNKLLGIVVALVFVGVVFTSYHITTYNAQVYSVEYIEVNNVLVKNPDYVPELNLLSPMSILAMLATSVGFSAFLMRCVFNLIGYLTGSYLAAIGAHIGMNLVIMLTNPAPMGAGLNKIEVVVPLLLICGSILFFTKVVQGKKGWK